MGGTQEISVTKVVPSMFPQVLPLLREMNPRLDGRTWERLFSPPWTTGEEHCGYALVDGDRVVGFLGLLFSRREIDGRMEPFCNLAAWYVQDAYRAHSLSLIMPVLRMRDHTVIDLSPSTDVVRISRRLGFDTLDTRVRLLAPTPPFLPVGRRSRRVEITRDADEIESVMSGSEAEIVRDHRDLPQCHLLLATAPEGHCLVAYTVTRDTQRPYCHIHHVGDPRFFAVHDVAIRRTMAAATGVWMHVVDERFVARHTPRWSVALPPRHVKLIRSRRVAPDRVDNLYSELVLLDIKTANSLEHLASRAVQFAAKSFTHRLRKIVTRRETPNPR